MLQITIPSRLVGWDEKKEEFVYTKEQTLQLEHSLVSISKWESKWNKAFLGKKEKTNEEILDYVRCMTINKNVGADIYNYMTDENITDINKYINAPMTATCITRQNSNKKNNDVVTSELIYFWMVSYNIPVEFEKWHLNRLLTLIEVCDVKNSPKKKMSGKEIASRNAALNAQRKARLGTRG